LVNLNIYKYIDSINEEIISFFVVKLLLTFNRFIYMYVCPKNKFDQTLKIKCHCVVIDNISQ